MKPIHAWLVAGAVIASIGLAACEEDPHYARHHDGVAVADDGYDVWYDNYYGDFYDGYWGDDGWYYYRPSRDHDFVRDDAHHFRRDRADGFNTFHAHDWRKRH